jgi:hypothetical protein
MPSLPSRSAENDIAEGANADQVRRPDSVLAGEREQRPDNLISNVEDERMRLHLVGRKQLRPHLALRVSPEPRAGLAML